MEQDCTVSQSTADEIKSFQATESKGFLCVVINVLTYVNQNRNHLAVLDFST